MFGGSSLAENSIKFLFNVSADLPSSRASLILKSYYLTRVQRLSLNGGINVSQAYTKAPKRCQYCSIPFNSEKPFYKIEPGKKQTKFIRKIISKNILEVPLTRYQDKFLRNLKRKGNDVTHNRLVIKCAICEKDAQDKLTKHKQKKKNVEISSITPRKKKKKKRDVFIGLNRDAVLSATPHKKILDHQSSSLTKTVVNNQSKKNTVHTAKLNLKQKKKNVQAFESLKNVLNNSNKVQSSANLQQFLKSI